MPAADSFRDRVVLVTGASAGIGRALGLRLGRAGARVGLLARREGRLHELAEKIGDPQRITLLPGDVSDPDFCAGAVERLVREQGGLDLLINNAGVSMNATFDQADLSVFRRMMEVNYFGALYLTRFALPHLERSSGGVVFISSVVGKRGFATRSGYSAAKFAVQGLFESLRVEWRERGVWVGLVAPGYTESEMREAALGPDGQPRRKTGMTVGRVMSAEDAAEAILEAAARRRREVVLTPEGKLMVWLNKLWPSLADRVAARAVG